jgi:hypothetical protein
MAEEESRGRPMLDAKRRDFRTLFLLRDLDQPLSTAVAENGGTSLEKAGRIDASFPDGGRATFTYTPRPPGGGDSVSFTLLGTCTHFQKKRLRRDAGARRDRVLARLQDAIGMVGVFVPPGASSPQVSRTVLALARRADAFVFSGYQLRDSADVLLLDKNGYVIDVVPDEWQLEKPRWRKKTEQIDSYVLLPTQSYVLAWGDAMVSHVREGAHLGEAVTVTAITEAENEEELARRLLSLHQRLVKLRGTAAVRERRDKVAFAAMRAKALLLVAAKSEDVANGTATRLAGLCHGWTVSMTDIRDESGRLLLVNSGHFDAAAGIPRTLLLLHPGATVQRAETRLAPGVEVRDIDPHGGGGEPLVSALRAFREIPLDPRGRRRRQELLPVFNTSFAQLIQSPEPLLPRHLRRVLRLARTTGAVTFDGWGIYDPSGRCLLTRDGRWWDPESTLPTEWRS